MFLSYLIHKLHQKIKVANLSFEVLVLIVKRVSHNTTCATHMKTLVFLLLTNHRNDIILAIAVRRKVLLMLAAVSQYYVLFAQRKGV